MGLKVTAVIYNLNLTPERFEPLNCGLQHALYVTTEAALETGDHVVVLEYLEPEARTTGRRIRVLVTYVERDAEGRQVASFRRLESIGGVPAARRRAA